MRTTFLISFIYLLIVPLQLLASDDQTDPLSGFIEQGMSDWHVPGMAVAVTTESEVLFQKGFGTIGADGGDAIDEHTLFAIASTTKAMIAASILILVDEEKITLDDLAIKHLPELQFGDTSMNGQVTIRDLLTHRTGLGSTDFWEFAEDMPLSEQVTRLQLVKPSVSLRSAFQYQNTMFQILGLIVESVSGRSWEEFLRTRIWLPLGMNETFAARTGFKRGQKFVLPYFYENDEFTQAKWDFEPDHSDAAGSVWSSISDMTKWAQFLLRGGVTVDGERLLSEASISEMFQPQMLIQPGGSYPTVALTKPNWTSYGLGWFQQDFQGRKIDFHTGSLSGLIALIGLDRAHSKAVIVLGNRDHAEMRHAVLWRVMDQRPLESMPDWNADISDLYQKARDEGDKYWKEVVATRLQDTQTSLAADAYLWTYENATMGHLTIVKTKDGLRLNTRKDYMDLSHWHLDTFLVQRNDLNQRFLISFQINTEGKVQSLDLFGDVFEKLEEPEK